MNVNLPASFVNHDQVITSKRNPDNATVNFSLKM